MELHKLTERLFAEGEKMGFTEMEVYSASGRSLELRVFEQAIDHYSISEDRGVSFRGLYDGQLGYAYTEKPDEESLILLLEKARQNARIKEKEAGEIFSGSPEYRDIVTYSPELSRVSPEVKIAKIKRLEKEVLNQDDRIKTVNFCLYADKEIEEKIRNNRGLALSYKNNFAYLFVSPVARENGDIKSTSRFRGSKKFADLKVEKLARETAAETVSLLGARSLPTGEYPVILRNDVAADLLATFSPAFSAEKVQQGMSLLAGKVGDKIAAGDVSLVDNPFYTPGIRATPFDAEGVATEKKNIINEGKLTTFLHNLTTAARDNVETTGNAYRSSHKSSIGIAPTNMYFKPGQLSYNDLINSLDRGLLIIDVQGLHSGADFVSGDFSLGAFGYYIKGGKIKYPVEQITIAGNFLELLKNITATADDLLLGIPRSGHFGSPSLKIESLSVAGE